MNNYEAWKEFLMEHGVVKMTKEEQAIRLNKYLAEWICSRRDAES